MGFKTFSAGVSLAAADVNDYLMEQVVIACTSGSRPGSPNEGMTIYETDTDKVYTYSGSAWVESYSIGAWTTYTPTFTNITSAAGSFAYKLNGKTLHLRFKFTAGTATATALCYFSLPYTTIAVQQSGGGSSTMANWLTDASSANFILNGGSNVTSGNSVVCTGSAVVEIA
jgi:hypothetical protein